MTCPKCGAQNMDGVSFCGSCGAQLAQRSPFPTEEPRQNVSYQQAQQPQPPLYGVPQGNAGYQSSYAGGFPNNTPIPPKNWMTESIIVTIVSFICCCSPISLILGIIAIVKANNVNTQFNMGNYNEANQNAESAKNFTMWAAIIAVIYNILGVLLYYFFFASIISQAGGLEELLNSLK